MPELRGAVIGCGFFARNHLHGWREVDGVAIVAVCDIDVERARSAASEFRVPRYYGDVSEMLERETLDFVDVVTQPVSHAALVRLAAGRGVHAICQKPLATSLAQAREMVDTCADAGVRLMVHENFRWQTPMRELKAAAAAIEPLSFARIRFRSAFDVYAAQPYLARDGRFILYDLGVHLLDLGRFFVGEVERVLRRHPRLLRGPRGPRSRRRRAHRPGRRR